MRDGKVHRVDDVKYMEPERTLCGLEGRVDVAANGLNYYLSRGHVRRFKAKLQTSAGVTCGACRRLSAPPTAARPSRRRAGRAARRGASAQGGRA